MKFTTIHKWFFITWCEILCLIKSDLITPRTVPEDVEKLFGPNLTHSEKQWLLFIDSNVYVGLIKCFWQLGIGGGFRTMWFCALHHASYPEGPKKLKLFCPAAGQLSQTHWHRTISVIGMEKVEPKSWAVFNIWVKQKGVDFLYVSYIFLLDPVLRPNVTFLLFQVHIFEKIAFRKIKIEAEEIKWEEAAIVSLF